MTLDEIITKCNIGEDHLTQEEYEQVGRWLEDYKVYKKDLKVYMKALDLACSTIAYSSPRMDEPYYYVKQYLQKAREEDNA